MEPSPFSIPAPRSKRDPEITDVRIRLRNEEVLKAFATITLNDCFVVHGLKVIEKADGRLVAMPNRKRRDGMFQDIAHPITRDFRNSLERRVLEEYDRALGRDDGGGAGVPAKLIPPTPNLFGAARVRRAPDGGLESI